jgi:hypothetical protein
MIKILRACSVKLDGVVQHFSPGSTLHLIAEKEQRIVRAGYGEMIQPDASEYRRLCEELSVRDPKAGCWDWVIQHQSETWQRFIQAFFAGDFATARTAFDEAVTAWKGANNG